MATAATELICHVASSALLLLSSSAFAFLVHFRFPRGTCWRRETRFSFDGRKLTISAMAAVVRRDPSELSVEEDTVMASSATSRESKNSHRSMDVTSLGSYWSVMPTQGLQLRSQRLPMITEDWEPVWLPKITTRWEIEKSPRGGRLRSQRLPMITEDWEPVWLPKITTRREIEKSTATDDYRGLGTRVATEDHHAAGDSMATDDHQQRGNRKCPQARRRTRRIDAMVRLS
ncbi:hypothetical protein B0T21DRAFT_417702 [Apiosordaria backusii]|uniref:Uncharacterized protein n=1 Tax=Apiosordaria backusii TaxID=314023 RepID=A0AA40EXU8_9PEZI|nr:hypothetical protein B0T21DRAFT_417702 [Apiosordaria backusii]